MNPYSNTKNPDGETFLLSQEDGMMNIRKGSCRRIPYKMKIFNLEINEWIEVDTLQVIPSIGETEGFSLVGSTFFDENRDIGDSITTYEIQKGEEFQIIFEWNHK